MANGLRLDMELSGHGWATVRLSAPHTHLEFLASYTPRDSIAELASAALALTHGLPAPVLVWHMEPEIYEFRFTTAADRTSIEVFWFRHWDRLRNGKWAAKIDAETIVLARVLWRGLRRLQGAVPAEEFATAWGHRFPDTIVEKLGAQLRVSTGE